MIGKFDFLIIYVFEKAKSFKNLFFFSNLIFFFFFKISSYKVKKMKIIRIQYAKAVTHKSKTKKIRMLNYID